MYTICIYSCLFEKILPVVCAKCIQKGQNKNRRMDNSALTSREVSEMPYDLYVYTCVEQVGTLSPAAAFTEVHRVHRNQFGFPERSVG